MMLFTKCILSQPVPEDGLRISVMSRHTLSDGVTSDARITNESFDKHWPEFGPSPFLIGSYYKRNLTWISFKERYLEQLRQPNICWRVRDLARLAVINDVTLLCIEESALRCHRRLLAEECKKYEPNLKIEHR